MKVLIIGNRGNMGRRYEHICRWFGHNTIPLDIGDKPPGMYEPDCAIIATPTDMHSAGIRFCISRSIPFLCEKPIDTLHAEVKRLRKSAYDAGVPAFMVCNWIYTSPEMEYGFGKHTIEYDCWRTGNDGLWQDCIQLVGMAKDRQSLKLNNEWPTFRASIDGRQITLDDIQDSYVRMIEDFLGNRRHLWTLDEAYKASLRVAEWSTTG